MKNLMTEIAYTIEPNLPRIHEFDYEVDGENINLSLLIGEDWKDEVIKRRDFETWLKDNDFLSGNYDTHKIEDGKYKSDSIDYEYSYEEFITEHLTDEIVREYIEETNQYKIA